MALAIHLAGRTGLEVDGVALPEEGLGRLGRLALAYLVAERHRPVDRHELAEVLWGEQLPATWESALRTHLTKVRAQLRAAGLDSDTLGSHRGTYQLVLPAGAVVDLEAAAADLDAARAHLGAGEAEPARQAAAAAAAVAGRQFLAGAAGAWVEQRQAEVRQLRLEALEVLAHAATEAGDATGAVRAATEAIALEPLRESAHVRLMAAHAAAGRRGEALRAYRHCRELLAEELGVDPSASTEAAYIALLGSEDDTALPQGVVTFLFTDIEASTRLWDTHPDAMAAALARHDGLMAEVIEAHRGRLLKSKGEGDGTVSVFAKASDAVAAASALQRAVGAEAWAGGLDLRIRVALHSGEAQLRDGDYFGTTLNRAARIRALAAGGQVLCSAATAALVADALPPGCALADRGTRQLKGLRRPEAVLELAPAEAVGSARAPLVLELPGALAGSETVGFVHRAAETELLDEAWAQARAGQTRLVLVSGEPGVGKTRLVTEFARHAHRAGAVVLAGRCDEGLGLPYQPFVQCLRHVLDHLEGQSIDAVLGPLAAELVRLVPDLGDRVTGLPEPLRADPETERYRLFEAVAGWLGALGSDQPVLLVLDDLQWATAPTVLLVRHLLGAERRSPLGIIATYRDTELDRHHPLAGLLGDLGRAPSVSRIGLGGLDRAGVGSLASQVSGQDLDESAEALVAQLHRETEGNPFFVGELVRHLDETGHLRAPDGGWAPYAGVAEVGVPEGVRHVVARRIGRLSDPAGRALSVASVIGSEFSLDLLAAVAGAPDDDVLDRVEEAVAAKLVVESPQRPGRFSFAHAIVRATLADELSTTRRARLHLRTAEALGALHAEAPARNVGRFAEGGTGGRLMELAHHHLEAVPLVDARVAARSAAAAAAGAETSLAYEDALRVCRRGLDALCADRDDLPSIPEACDLLLRQGRSELFTGRPGARETLLQAADMAADLHDADRMAEALLSLNRGFFARMGRTDRPFVERLERAIAARPPGDDIVTAELLATMASELVWAKDGERRFGLSDAALAMARRLGDERALARVLLLRNLTISSPDTLLERIVECEELLRLADHLQDPWIRFQAAFHGSGTAHEAGDVAAAHELVRLSADIAVELRQPSIQWMADFMLTGSHLGRGELDEAEALANQALTIGTRANRGAEAQVFFGEQLLEIRRWQDRLPEVLDFFAHLAGVDGADFGYSLLRYLHDAGEMADARRIYEEVMECLELPLRRDLLAMPTLCNLSYLAAACDDQGRAPVLYRELEPWGAMAAKTTVARSVGHHYLGLLARTIGDYDRAETHLRSALAAHRAMELPLLVGETLVELADLAVRRPEPSDAGPTVLDRVRRTAEEAGARYLLRRCDELLTHPPAH